MNRFVSIFVVVHPVNSWLGRCYLVNCYLSAAKGRGSQRLKLLRPTGLHLGSPTKLLIKVVSLSADWDVFIQCTVLSKQKWSSTPFEQNLITTMRQHKPSQVKMCSSVHTHFHHFVPISSLPMLLAIWIAAVRIHNDMTTPSSQCCQVYGFFRIIRKIRSLYGNTELSRLYTE